MTRQDQQQQTENPDDAFKAHIESRLKDLHTMVPGIIESYDPDTQAVRTLDNKTLQLDPQAIADLAKVVAARRRELFVSSWAEKDAL